MFKSGIIVMIITMLSRILGLGRTTLVAVMFGATNLTDAFNSAFKIANLFRQLLGEGALGTVFIPVYNDKVKEVGEEKAKSLMFSILNILFLFLIVIYGFTFIFSKGIIETIARGYTPETVIWASRMLKIMAVYIVFIGMSGMMCAVLNNYKKFATAASTSIFFNLAIITSTFYLKPSYGIYALCIGVVIGGLLQFLVVLPEFFKIVRKYSFRIDWKDPSLKLIFTMLLPMLVGIFARQFNTVIDQFFASYLAQGGVSVLENATRIYNLPLGVFGISIATVVYPTLSKAVSNNDEEKVRTSIEMGLKLLSFLVIPSIMVLTFFAGDVVRIILGYGRYGVEAVKATSEALAFYSIGLYFYTANHILNRAFYARKNTKDPVKFSIITIAVNVVLNALLIKSMAHMGLALATALASTLNFVLLYIYNRKMYVRLNERSLVAFIIKVAVSGGIALLSAYFIGNMIRLGSYTRIESIMKLGVFSVAYLLLWAYPIKKGGLDVFRGNGTGNRY